MTLGAQEAGPSEHAERQRSHRVESLKEQASSEESAVGLPSETSSSKESKKFTSWKGRSDECSFQFRGVFFQRESAGNFPISLLKSLKVTSVSYQCFSI